MSDNHVDNMLYLFQATKGMGDDDKKNFMVGLVGSLSALVCPETWRKGVDITRLVMECSDAEEILQKGKEILGRDDV